MTQYIHYGSIIRIQVAESRLKGTIVGKGFFDKEVYFQSYENFDQISNYRDGLFQILPRGSYEFHDEFFKNKQYGQKNAEEAQLLHSEKQQYFAMMENKLNEVINFSGEVIFRHVDSGYYLCCTEECSETRNDSFKLKLNEHLSSQIIFRLESSRSHQKSGSPIPANETIRIQSEIQKFWIDRNINQPVQMDNVRIQSEFRPNLKGISPHSHRYELIITHNQNHCWKLMIHESYDNQQMHLSRIKNHEYCTLKVNDLYLCGDPKKNIICFRQIPDNYIPIECIWEIEFDEKKMNLNYQNQKQTFTNIKPLGNRPSIFPVYNYNSNPQSQQPSLQTQSNFNSNSRIVVLHHLLTGKTLCARNSFDDDDCKPADLTEEFNSVELVLADNDDRDIVDGSFVNILSEDLYLQLLKSKSNYINVQQKKLQIRDQGLGGFYKYLAGQDEYYKCGFKDSQQVECFTINKINQNILFETLKALSAQEALSYYMQMSKYTEATLKEYSTQELLQNQNQLIIGLTNYLNSDEEDFDGESQVKIPIFRRQLILKDIFFIELIVEMIYNLCYKGNTKNLSIWKQQKLQIKQIFEKSYNLLFKVIQKNSITKLYTSQWLEMFLHQYIKVNEYFIQETLAELLNNNQIAIKRFVNLSVIQKIIEIIESQEPDQKYLQILSSFCTSNNQPFKDIQNMILSHFFLKVGFDYRFQFKLEADQVFVLCPIQKVNKFRTFRELFEESFSKDHFKQWHYFISYLNLLGDVCMKRNKLAKKYVEDNFPLSTLNLILTETDKNPQYNLLFPILKLIKYAYVDASPYEKVKTIYRVHDFNLLDREEPKLKDVLQGDSHLRKVMDFLLIKISQFKKGQFDSTFYTNQLKVLNVILCSLEMGFWTNQEHIQSILKVMYEICSNNNTNNKQIQLRVRENQGISLSCKSLDSKLQQSQNSVNITEEFLLKIECKKVACEIIKIIYNMETNTRIFLATKLFKQQLYQYQIIDGENNFINQRNYSQKQKMNGSIRLIADKFKTILNDEEKQMYDPLNWIEQFKELLQQRSMVNFSSFELIFAELSFFENKQLTHNSLQILNRVYGQRKELIRNFEKVIIVASGQTMELADLSSLIYSKLDKITDPYFFELYTKDSKQNRQSLIWFYSSEAEKAGFIQNFYQISRLMKKDFDKGRCLNPLNYDDYNSENRSILPFCEREQNYRLHQSLLFAQELHIPILQFISNFEISLPSIYWKLLQASYDYLTTLVWNHMESKQQISIYKQAIYKHIKYNVNSIELLKVLFVNNKVLLYSESEIYKILQLVLETCNSLGLDQYLKSKTLDFLRVILIFNSTYLNLNQKITLQKIQDTQFTKILLKFSFNQDLVEQSPHSVLIRNDFQNNVTFSGSESSRLSVSPEIGFLEITEQEFVRFIIEYEASYSKLNEGYHEISIGPCLSYVYTYFQIFCQLIEDRHSINMKKCCRMYSFEEIIKLMSLSNNCWPLKKYLRAYINRMFYKNTHNISKGFIMNDLTTIVQDLQEIIDIRTDSRYSYMNMATIINPIRFKYLSSYIYLYLEEILLTLKYVLKNSQFLEDLEQHLIQSLKTHKLITHFQIFELVKQLNLISNIYDKQILSHMSKFLINMLYNIISTFDNSVLIIREALFRSTQEQIYYQENVTIQHIKQLDEKQSVKLIDIRRGRDNLRRLITSNLPEDRQYLIDQIFDFNYEINHQDKINTVIKFWKSNNRRLHKEDFNESINHKFKMIINKLNLSVHINSFFQEEFTDICQKMNLIGQESMKVYKTNFEVITLQDYIKNIIQMSLNTTEIFNDELRVFFFKMLTRLITEKNHYKTENIMEVDQWSSQIWDECKGELIKAQEFLIDCGAADLVIQSFTQNRLETKLELLNSALLFCIALLLGGNSRGQKALLDQLIADPTNTVLVNFRNIITLLTRVINNNFTLTTKLEKQEDVENILTVDNHDFFDQASSQMIRLNVIDPDDAKETSFKKNCLDALCRAFRVLQLLCENNNVEMKMFLRQQVDQNTVRATKQQMTQSEQISNQQNSKPKLVSINFIEFTSVQLRIYLKILSKAVIAIPISILDFIIEIIQLPCIDNQTTLCHTTFFEDVSRLAQYFAEENHSNERLLERFGEKGEFYELQNKILIAILSVLEGNEEKIYKDLQNKLDAQFLISFLSQNLLKLKIENPNDLNTFLFQQSKVFNEDMLKILNVCIIEKKIASYSENRWVTQFHEKIALIPKYKEIYEQLRNLIHNIEIVYNGKKMTVFFPFHPLFNLLSAQTKEDLLFNVNRDTQRDKLIGMFEQTKILDYELDHNYNLNHMSIPITQKNLDIIQQLSSFVVTLINLSMIYFYTVIVSENTYYLSSSVFQSFIINTLSIIQLTTQATLFAMLTLQRAPILFEKNNAKVLIQQVYVLLKYDAWLLQLLLVILSFLGVSNNPIYFVIHQMECVSRFPILKSVFQAISYNAIQLLMVSFLGVLFVYAFSAISFSVYFDDIYQGEQIETCDSLITCMITLITSGVIGNSMINWDPFKFFFDMIFTVFFGLLFTNIVQGIMIDTFAALRDQRVKIEEDIKNKCFICAAQRTELEKSNQSFEEHTQIKHQIWNYIFYQKCLNLKEWTEYTGLEYWIFEKIQKEDISWFPESVDEGQNIQDKLDKIESILQQMIDLSTQEQI